jgi:cellobiose-specific phosphotransferase system component IIA
VSDRRDRTEPEFPDLDDEAIDLALVHADDEYLDRLSGAQLEDPEGLFDGFGDDQLTELLMSWRRDVDAEPIDELVDTKLATVTVHAARTHRKRRPRLLVPIAAAAAVLAIAFAGVGLAARGAQPGDTLWALTKVLYADHARSVEAAQAVKDDLREAKAALAEGNIDEAKSKLEDAHAALPTVLPDDGRNDLQAEHTSLMAQLPGSTSDQAGSPPQADPSTEPNPGSSGSSDGGSSTDTAPSNPATDTPTDSPTAPDTTSESTPPPSETSRSDPGSGTSGGQTVNNAPAGEGEPAGGTP